MRPFEPLPPDALPHGVLVAVPMPDTPEPVPVPVLNQLADAERVHALGLGGFRQVHFVGGRTALRAARRALGAPLGPVLPDPRGTPQMPKGFVGSISHKRDLAVALVARDHGWTIGVDLEDYGPARPRIAEKVLRPAEIAAIEELPDDRRWIATVLRFSIKESIYKALDPWVRRYVDFQEAEVTPDLAGRAAVTLHLTQGEGPFEVEARYVWWEGRILTSVRLRPLSGDAALG